MQPALRLCAILSLLFWITGTSYCSVESLFGSVAAAHHESHDGHDHGRHGKPAKDSDHSKDSDNSSASDDACCKSVTTVVQCSGATQTTKPLLVSFSTFALSMSVPELKVFRPDVAPTRHMRTREWPFTPAVYLGPALRSNGPPLAS